MAWSIIYQNIITTSLKELIQHHTRTKHIYWCWRWSVGESDQTVKQPIFNPWRKMVEYRAVHGLQHHYTWLNWSRSQTNKLMCPSGAEEHKVITSIRTWLPQPQATPRSPSLFAPCILWYISSIDDRQRFWDLILRLTGDKNEPQKWLWDKITGRFISISYSRLLWHILNTQLFEDTHRDSFFLLVL